MPVAIVIVKCCFQKNPSFDQIQCQCCDVYWFGTYAKRKWNGRTPKKKLWPLLELIQKFESDALQFTVIHPFFAVKCAMNIEIASVCTCTTGCFYYVIYVNVNVTIDMTVLDGMHFNALKSMPLTSVNQNLEKTNLANEDRHVLTKMKISRIKNDW